MVGIVYPSSATNSFSYNGNDMRMQKVDSAGTANYLCDGTTPASAVLKDGAAVYTPGLSERRGTTSKFYHGDGLGSTRGITNTSQAVTDSVLYDGFGMTVSRTGTTPTPFGFVGKGQYQTDNDSGLMLLGHRYYDASVGRFISSDPAKAGDNWYAYCENNPLDASDPNGLDLKIIGFSDQDTAIIKKTIGRIRTSGGIVGKQIGSKIDSPPPGVTSGQHIIINPPRLEPGGNPNPDNPNWPNGKHDPNDPTTYHIYIDPNHLPGYIDQNGKDHAHAPIESVIAHELGHILAIGRKQQGKTFKDDENIVITNYQNPVERALHLPLQRLYK